VKVPDLLANAVLRFPDRACLIQDDRSLTFAEVDARADRLSQAFRASGLEPGDRVALLSLSEIEYTEIQVAAQRAEVILVPLNFRLAQAELRAITADCAPKLLIHGPEYAEAAAALACPQTWHLGTDGVGEPYDDVLARFEPTGDRPYLASDTTCTILYTSGTTGKSKGAITSNGAIFARINLYALEHSVRAGGTFLFPIPMFHVSSSLATRSRTAAARSCRCATSTSASGHPARATSRHARGLRADDDRPRHRAADRRAGRPELARADHLRRLADRTRDPAPRHAALGCDFAQGYGLTEAVNATMLRREEHDPDGRPELLTSAGKASISYDVRIFGPDDTELPPGEVGELVVAGPGVMDGYWNSPEETAHVLRGGWLHTGDLGYRSEDGFLYITDRLKDVIVSGGENVYTREVEDALHDHEAVLEVAVVGIPSPKWGEAVHAVVVLRKGASAGPDELIAHCRERLAAYKAPKSVEIVDDLPKNASGKILKREVRAAYWRGADRAVG
jgi:Acyl-CoA synthetases (AMP-forming)/AMP-acid ligases II